jgi:hypothetical protein
MKDLLLKILFVLIFSLFESTVGLPVLFLTMFLVWKDFDLIKSLIWLGVISLFLSVMWGGTWWMTCLFLIAVGFAYDYLEQFIFNKMLRLLTVILPSLLIFAMVIKISFNWRIVLYGILSLAVIFIFQKFLLTSYEKKYL